ncbi:unnamed protein product [Diplocarpon coronariae]
MCRYFTRRAGTLQDIQVLYELHKRFLDKSSSCIVKAKVACRVGESGDESRASSVERRASGVATDRMRPRASPDQLPQPESQGRPLPTRAPIFTPPTSHLPPVKLLVPLTGPPRRCVAWRGILERRRCQQRLGPAASHPLSPNALDTRGPGRPVRDLTGRRERSRD